MVMKQKKIAFVLLILLSVNCLNAQESKPLIQLNDFSTLGISSEESRLIKALFLSYLSEMGELINYLEQEQSLNTAEKNKNRPVDYSINGTVRLEQDGHIFLLEITNLRTAETYTIRSVYKTTGELALKARSMLETAFAESMEPEKQGLSNPETISENQITGTWKGEAGIEMINLQKGGRGVAFFSSGAQMVLSYSITDNTLRLWQVSPNSERFYYPLPFLAAKYLAAGAQPMVWEMSLFQKGTVLNGVRQATAVRMEYDQVGELIHGGDVRQVQWTKVSH